MQFLLEAEQTPGHRLVEHGGDNAAMYDATGPGVVIAESKRRTNPIIDLLERQV
jgi:hypothetical protein